VAELTGTPVRVALIGLPGAGKSTSAGILRRALTDAGCRVAVVRIAAPLYDVQAHYYGRAGQPLAGEQQDGALLNFLGSHFRASVPGFLMRDFETRCAYALLVGADVLVCDDARPTDVPELVAQGFVVVRVSAPDEIRRCRKGERGDRTAGADDHPTERGIDSVDADVEIVNAGSLETLSAEVVQVAGRLRAGTLAPRVAGAAVDRIAVVEALVEVAKATIAARYAENRHQIGAVLLDGTGQVYTGLHVEAMVGRASVCAEAVALGKAREAGATDLRLVLAVRHPKPSEVDSRVRLVPPCGLCRELLLDYGPDLRTVVEHDGRWDITPLADLLPHKYVGTKWATTAVKVPAGSARP
jgi:cytidine deaminase